MISNRDKAVEVEIPRPSKCRDRYEAEYGEYNGEMEGEIEAARLNLNV